MPFLFENTPGFLVLFMQYTKVKKHAFSFRKQNACENVKDIENILLLRAEGFGILSF